MGFFDSLGGFLGGVGSIASVAAPLIGAFKSQPKAAPASGQLDARTTQANQMATAATDPNDPMYRNLVRLEEEAGRVDIARAVNEMLRQRKHMAQKYGANRYGAWFNPEREDEGLSSAVSRAGMDVGERARKTARDTLLGGSAAVTSGLPGTAALAGLQNQQDAAKNLSTTQLYNTIGAAGNTLSQSDWIKELNNKIQYNNTYSPPNQYYDWQYYG